jgi:acyl-CoA synthetase (AMP-forming)/AMP-acid ligase II
MHTAAIPRTIPQTLRRVAARFADRDAIVMGERRLTHAAVLREAGRHAAALARLGIGRDQHVGLLMPNCLEYLLLFYGCALLGARPVHLNSRYKRDDLRYVIADSDIRILFTSAKQREHVDYAATLRDIYPELARWRYGTPLAIPDAPLLTQVFDLHAGGDTPWGHEGHLYPEGLRLPDALPALDPEDIGLIMYTSGTTAHPKACLLSHRALEGAGHALAERWRMTEQDRFWDPLPFFHMSTMLPLAACRASGACFIAQEHFEPGASLREIADERATILFPSFPTLTNALFAHPDFDAKRLAAVRIVNDVGPPDLLRRYAAILPTATHVSAYGLTEAGGVIAFHGPDDPPELLAETSGRAFDGIEVRIVDPDSLAPLPCGERGEIWIRGPTNFSGYYKDPVKTASTVTPEGFIRTGDLGSLEPSGHIRYLGRIKDMLKVGGENVAAIEIESYLCTHPAVKVAQVVGVADARLQEVAAAFIELHDGASLTREDVIRFCKGHIASFKIPRYVRFVTGWPMSATKIQKFRLRDQVDPAERIEPAEVA